MVNNGKKHTNPPLGDSDKANRPAKNTPTNNANGKGNKAPAVGRSGRGSAGSGKSAEIELAEIKKALAKKNEEAERERQEVEKLRKKLQVQKKNAKTIHKRPRPPGENGKKGWKLIDKMGLEKDKLRYNAVLRGVRQIMDNAALNPRKYLNKQDPGRLHQVFTEARHQFPILEAFEDDWATREIIKNALHNRRKKIRKEAEILGEDWTQEKDVMDFSSDEELEDHGSGSGEEEEEEEEEGGGPTGEFVQGSSGGQ